MLNHLYAKINDLDIDQDTVLAFTASYTFDISVWQMFASLLCGGSCVIYREDLIYDPGYLVGLIEADGVTILELVPSYLSSLLQEETNVPLSQLKYLLVTGEAVSQPLLSRWFSHPDYGRIPVVNAYGPTEASDDICHYFLYESPDRANIPVGKPIQNLQVYVLDSNLQLCPVGITGEICVSGVGVGRGYLNLPALTAEKFVDNPFGENGGKLYRTGDLGRWLPDGNIECLGRIDHQVKIHGYRIELEEVENVLQTCPLVHQAIVSAKAVNDNPVNQDWRLVGYIVPNGVFDIEAILAYLKEKLPVYMVPALLVALDKFPLTTNGKIDRNALPDPGNTLMLTNVYVAPRNETEHLLAGIWEELLHKSPVGINDNFFELGGHSLLAMRLAAVVRKRLQLEVAVKSLFHYPTIAELVAHLQETKPALLLPAIEADQRPAAIPLSYSQERLWFIDQLEGSVQYHLSAALTLKGALDITALSNALQTIVNRHEVLRTVIKQTEGVAYQHVLDQNQWQLTVTDLPAYRQSPAILKEYVQSLIATPFNLEKDHMLKGQLIVSGENEHVLLIVLHHIACDGWSVSILVNELIALYEANATGSTAALAPIPVQYADYAVWQRQYLSGDVLAGKLSYWENKLKDAGTLQLPGYSNHSSVHRNKGAGRRFHLNRELTDALQQLSLQQGATLFMTLLTAFKVLLYRYSGEEDISVGSPIAGRTQAETEGLIGFFVNTLVLRSNLAGQPSFATLLQQVKTTTLEAYEHQDVPFEKIVEAVVKDRDVKGNPLFRVLFSLQNIPAIPALRLGSVLLSPLDIPHVTTQFDITVNIQENANGLTGDVIYAVDLFSEEMIDGILLHFEQLLQAVVTSPDTRIGALPMLTTAEVQQLDAFNDTTVISLHHPEQTILHHFAAQVADNPSATAIICGDTSISYAELNKRSNNLAHYLRSLGVKAETLVPLCMERSAEMIIGIWGIWKAGGAYVPIDPDYPQERISYILSDTAADIVVSSKACLSKLSHTSGLRLITLDDKTTLPDMPAGNGMLETPGSRQLAYIIYTSGSTGRPKGVMIEHGSLLNYLRNNQTAYIDDNSGLTGSFIHFSYTFDASLTAMFMPLLSGKTVVIGKSTGVAVFEDSLFQQYAPYDFIKLTPAHLPLLASATEKNGGKLFTKRLVVGGEALLPAHLAYFLEHSASVEIINEYGPTEATVGCSTFSFYTSAYTGDNQNGISIGRPIDNVQLYILDDHMNKVPVGVYGEIVIGGRGLARGYLHLPELTTEKFIVSPFGKNNTVRLYRTGDTGRWLADGTIEYLGRTDDQVKIRGYRVESGEVESVLQEYHTVSQAVVLAQKDSSGSYRLTAYVVAGDGFERADVFSWLKHRLPEYMVPAQLITIPELPLTVHGKIDKKVLLATEYEATAAQTEAGPRSQMEWALTAIWQELLELDEVSINDNFFEIGGHSLLVIRMISLIRKRLSLEVPIGDVFDYPSISVLAPHLDRLAAGTALPAIVAQTRPEHVPLSYSQERLWFIDRLEGSVQYHIPYVLHLKGDLDIGALANTLRDIIQRHEVLRTVIRHHHGTACQHVMDTAGWQMVIEEQPADTAALLHNYVQSLIVRPFNLSEDYMLRAHLLVKGASEHILVVTMHHIASDGWSAGIMVRELTALYGDYAAGVAASLPAMNIQYADYVLWQQQYLSGDVLTDKLSYWKTQLEGVTLLQLPVDYKHLVARRTQGASRQFRLNAVLSEQLQTLSRQQGVTLFMTLLAAFKVLLYRYTGQEDICVGSPVAGRSQQELEGLVGFFVNMLALRSDLRDNPSFVALLQQVKTTTLNAYTHQDVPFEKVVETVVKERNMSTTPLFRVLFSLQNVPEIPQLRLENLQLEQVDIEETTTQFDITFSIQETAHGLTGNVTYSTGLFREETIARMVQHYEQLLQSIITTPESPIGALPMLSFNEAAQLMELSGVLPEAAVVYPHGQTLPELFSLQAARTPDATALVFEKDSLTYRELDERSNRLAHYLQRQGVANGALVPLCLERSLEMIICILGVLKAGAAYVPIHPDEPADRIRYMLADTSATVVVGSRNSVHKFAGNAVHVICADDERIYHCSDVCQDRCSFSTALQGSDLAYVIYTSGSTGLPKGVLIEHHSVVNLVTYQGVRFGITPAERILQYSNYNFDASVEQIFLALLHGAALVLINESVRLDMNALERLLHEERITHLHATPGILELLTPGRYNGLKRVISGGEYCSRNLAMKWKDDTDFYNEYGPTETTVTAAEYHSQFAADDWQDVIPIGRAVANTRLYVLDKWQQPVPIGIPGELFIGGVQVARGYLNRDEQTAAAFLTDPFISEGRMYKTGDIVRWLPDGNVEYIGRADNQVKIRGYRIELGEIENVLQQCEEVKEGVVVVRTDNQDNKYLVAYVVPEGTFEKTVIIQYLQNKLPAYMIPFQLVGVNKLPLTANGKIDRRALPDPEESMQNAYVAPRNETEEKLVTIWQELLHKPTIGIYDNFFDLGGHSLLSIRLISKVRETLQVEISLATFFELATIEGLSRYISVNQPDSISDDGFKTIQL
ncbi:MAG TPA: amino acid adenylation domain-containing protein [Chitinophaga sp.]|uniref:non-ribosomal peptide synthetase n=1 Tax=Chitinophaga sp. TaxID=1869181 RepID=UPI002CCBF29D|nr:non-ribosomal peptide synthetase [Chitinophaga sp.]HVI47173.1 amino acid adenylation domain-containing protein [Chitinophaga sp.]